MEYNESVLKELRSVEQEILDFVVQKCEEYSLRYSLGYGTLIGAIRHRGFIPWDDDIDIIMPRGDYEKLLTVLEKEDQSGFYIQNYYTDSDFTEVFTKVRKYNTTFFSNTGYCNPNMCGIFIDVFPADLVPNKKIIKAIHFSACAINLLFSKRHTSDSNYFIKAIETLLLKLPVNFQYMLRNKSENIKKAWNKNGSGMYVNSSTIEESRVYYPNYIFDDFIDVVFEGKKYKAMKQYDIFLRIMYGDYMTLPPAEARVWGHIPDIIDFKNNYK